VLFCNKKAVVVPMPMLLVFLMSILWLELSHRKADVPANVPEPLYWIALLGPPGVTEVPTAAIVIELVLWVIVILQVY
jgi:hypothetical protein